MNFHFSKNKAHQGIELCLGDSGKYKGKIFVLVKLTILMPKDNAIETAENQLGNAGSQLWRHLVNTHGSPRYSAFGVRCWKIPPLS